jgi:type I restriction enzyme S subunit
MKTSQISLKNNFTPYPETRDSGIDWIGKIPKEWKIEPLKRIAPFISRGNSPEYVESSNTKVISQACIYWGGLKLSKVKYDSRSNIDFLKGKVLSHDLLMNSTGTGTLGRIAAFTHKPGNYFADSHVTIIRTDHQRFSHAFLKYLFQTDLFQGYIYASSVSGSTNQIELSRERLKIVPVIFPPLKRQEIISSYLDEKIALVDQIIERKKRLIELLREKRTAVINDCMLHAAGEFTKIKHRVEMNPSRKSIKLNDLDSLVSFVPMEALSEHGELHLQKRKYSEVKEGFTYFEDGDVVLAKITPCYENGKAGVMHDLKHGFGFGTTEFLVLRPQKKILPEYLYFLIFSDRFRKLGEVEMRGTAGQKRVSNAFVKNYEFLLPEMEEQKKQVALLRKQTELIDGAVKTIEQSMKILQEFKSSLISSVVTGKIMV